MVHPELVELTDVLGRDGKKENTIEYHRTKISMNVAQLKSRAISKEGLGLAKGVCDSIAFLTDPVE